MGANVETPDWYKAFEELGLYFRSPEDQLNAEYWFELGWTESKGGS